MKLEPGIIIRLLRLKKDCEAELERILSFWSDKAIDKRYGGFVGRIAGNGQVDWEAPKSAVLNARILWTFAAAARLQDDPRWRVMADRAFEYLIGNFWDSKRGGLFWSLSREGTVLNSRKQAYAQGFGIYAFSEYYRATDNVASLGCARELFRLLQTHFLDFTHGGYVEALDRNWQPLVDMRLSEKDLNCPKSMNTHLHLLEPYVNLYRAWQSTQLREAILNLITVFLERIINHDTGHLNLFFGYDWTVESDLVSYGHDIEAAWLLREAALETGEPAILERVNEAAMLLINQSILEGCDKDGALFYEKEKQWLNTDKHWWPQAEAMVALMDAFALTGEPEMLSRIEKIWAFLREKMFNFEHGEWHARISIDGQPYPHDDIIGFWKCPYHNSRAMLEIISRIDVLIGATGKTTN